MSAASTLRFAGYAALFDIADAGGDIIRHGAFTRTLAARREPWPLLWQHHPYQRIGSVAHIAEDARGLQVIASVDRPSSRAADLLAARAVNGLSFGYRAVRFVHSGSVRELIEVELFEISLVTHPLQHRARVHLVA